MGIPQIIVLVWTALELYIGWYYHGQPLPGKIDFRVQGISCAIKLIVLGPADSSANKKADVNRQLSRFERASFSRGIF